MIEIPKLLELIVVAISISLALHHWQPPIPKGQQGLMCLIAGGLLGYIFAGWNMDGILTGLIASSVAFWRGELFAIFKEVREETSDMLGGNSNEPTKEVNKI